MLSNETVRKLLEIHLSIMAEAFSAQLEDAQFQAVSFEDRFAMADISSPPSQPIRTTSSPIVTSGIFVTSTIN